MQFRFLDLPAVNNYGYLEKTVGHAHTTSLLFTSHSNILCVTSLWPPQDHEFRQLLLNTPSSLEIRTYQSLTNSLHINML